MSASKLSHRGNWAEAQDSTGRSCRTGGARGIADANVFRPQIGTHRSAEFAILTRLTTYEYIPSEED